MNRVLPPISMLVVLLLPHALGSCGDAAGPRKDETSSGAGAAAETPAAETPAAETPAAETALTGTSTGSSKGAVTEPDAYDFEFGAPREIVTRDDAFRVIWYPENGRVPINEHFTVDVTLLRNDEARTPVDGAIVTISCFMPDHGHGMLREPRSEELGDGKYRVNGFLLHMDGYWTVSVNVLVDGLAATAEDELRL